MPRGLLLDSVSCLGPHLGVSTDKINGAIYTTAYDRASSITVNVKVPRNHTILKNNTNDTRMNVRVTHNEQRRRASLLCTGPDIDKLAAQLARCNEPKDRAKELKVLLNYIREHFTAEPLTH